MTHGQNIAISNLYAGAANFESDIIRGVVDRTARDAARKLLAEALRTAIAGTEVAATKRPK
jgi:hypothetical protein